jgi:hypothetical protein
MIHVQDEAGNVIEMHEHAGDFKISDFAFCIAPGADVG